VVELLSLSMGWQQFSSWRQSSAVTARSKKISNCCREGSCMTRAKRKGSLLGGILTSRPEEESGEDEEEEEDFTEARRKSLVREEAKGEEGM
jgi:hypothetical protein